MYNISKYKTPEVFKHEEDSYPIGSKRLILLGPPGTGKTSHLLNSFILPALNLGVMPEQILSCSFTRAAARELRDRLGKQTNYKPNQLLKTCSTIHAEALRLFRRQFYGQKFEIIGEPRAATDEDSEGPVSRFEEALPEGFEIKEAIALRIWDLARNSLITNVNGSEFFQIVRAIGGRVNMEDVKSWIKTYEERKRSKKLLDFTDILLKALQCQAPQRDLFIVDESQDCSMLQFKLVEKWIAGAKSSVIVGDPDQSIYAFNSAKPEKIFDLIDSGFDTRRLGQSFRVPAKIHKVARSVILQNKNRIDAPYNPMEREGSVVELTHDEASAELSEAAFEDLEAFVLARSGKILESWAETLTERGVPFINERGKSPWGAPVALAVTRAVMAIREEKPIMANDARRLIDHLPGRHEDYFKKGTTKRATVAGLLNFTGGSIQASELDDMGVLSNRIKTADLRIVLEELGLKDRAYSIPRVIERHGTDSLYNTPKVKLTTIHSSKGREADLVVIDLEMPKMTRWAVSKDPSVIDEERRLIYVALTRSKDSLILVRGSHDLGSLVGLPKIEK